MFVKGIKDYIRVLISNKDMESWKFKRNTRGGYDIYNDKWVYIKTVDDIMEMWNK
jgi:hypothetical protein